MRAAFLPTPQVAVSSRGGAAHRAAKGPPKPLAPAISRGRRGWKGTQGPLLLHFLLEKLHKADPACCFLIRKVPRFADRIENAVHFENDFLKGGKHPEDWGCFDLNGGRHLVLLMGV